MQEKNEIKEENFDDKLMLKKKEKQKELLQKYFEYDNGIISNLTNLKKEKQNFDKTFLENPNLDKIKNTPIFYLSEILKEMNLKELENLESCPTLFEKKSEINKLIWKFLNPIKNFKDIKNNILNKIYERIEYKIIDDYIKEHYEEEGKKINRNNEIKLDEEIAKAEEMEKEIPLNFPNELLKQIIKKQSEFIGLIGEKDDEEKKILNEIKEEINSIMKDSESGEISKKWNFNDPKLKRLDMGYFFKVIGDKQFLLDDTKKEEKDRKKKQEYLIILKEEDADNIIDQMMDKIHNLPLYERIKETPELRKLINKLLYINDNAKGIPAEPISKEETERLMDLLGKFENIHFFFQYLNKYRSKTKFPPENEFDIMVNIFKNIASFCLKMGFREIFPFFLILSQTYCKTKGKDNYTSISDIMKEHDLFHDIECWEIYLYDKLFSEKENKNNAGNVKNGENLSKDEVSMIANNIALVLSEAYSFRISKGSILDLINRAINKFPERYREEIRKAVIENLQILKK